MNVLIACEESHRVCKGNGWTVGVIFMQELITFILRMFTACFYTLVFLGALSVVAVIVTLAEMAENEKEKERRK